MQIHSTSSLLRKDFALDDDSYFFVRVEILRKCLSRWKRLAFGGAVSLFEQDFDFALGGLEVLAAFFREARAFLEDFDGFF
jgi:hypothetical protein